MRKIGIIWANPYNDNLGVAALAYSALAIVVDALEESDEDIIVSFIGSTKFKSDSFRIKGKDYYFESIGGLDYFKLKSLIKLVVQYKKYRIFKLLGFDYILDLSEGDSFADIYGRGRFNRIVNSKIVFNLFGKKQLLLPQTIGPFNSKVNEKKAFNILKKFTYVYSRDKISYEYSKKFLPEKKIEESIDLAFYLPYENITLESQKIKVGINVSGLLWNGGYTKNNQFGLKTDYKELIEKSIEFFLKNNSEVHLIAHVILEDVSIEDDYCICKKLIKYYPEVILAPSFASPIEAKSYIAGMDFFTGARMHSTIAAFSSGVPVYPMAYSRKFNGLFTETLNYHWIGDCVNNDTEIVFDGLVKAYTSRQKLKEQIVEVSREIISPRIERLKAKLKDLILNEE